MVDISRGAGTSGPLPDEELWMMANQIGREKGIDPSIVYRIIMQESGGDPSARGADNDLGLMQVTPIAAEDLGIEHSSLEGDPWGQVRAGTQHFANTRERMGPDASTEEVLAAYNAGVRGAGLGRGQDYARSVMAREGRPPGISDYSPSAPAMTVDDLPPGGAGSGNLGVAQRLMDRSQMVPGVPGPVGESTPYVSPEERLMARSNVVPGEPSPVGEPTPPTISGLPAARPVDTMGVPTPSMPGGPGGRLPAARDIDLDAPPGAAAPLDSPTADAGAAGGGGLGGAPRSLVAPGGGGGGGWKDALKQMAIPLAGALSGGRVNPMLAFGVGKMKGESKRRISEWETEQKVKTETEKRDLEAAEGIMEELEGFDLSTMMRQVEQEHGRDSTQFQALLQASDAIDKISKKYADAMDPEGPGGVGITPGEAKELILMKNRFRNEISTARTGSARVGMGLEAEGAVAKERARREAFPEIAKSATARAEYNKALAELAKAKAENPELFFGAGGMNMETFAAREDIRNLMKERTAKRLELGWNQNPEDQARLRQEIAEIDRMVGAATGGGAPGGAPSNPDDPLGIL